jgi:mono/diheme cytochrome c family protein
MSSKSRVLAFVAAIALSTAANAALASIESGRELASEACSACHQVAPTQTRPPPVAEGDEGSHVQAPTFAEIAARCAPADRLRALIANPHYPMREQMLSTIDLDSLSAYIVSLAPVTACPVR